MVNLGLFVGDAILFLGLCHVAVALVSHTLSMTFSDILGMVRTSIVCILFLRLLICQNCYHKKYHIMRHIVS